MQQSLIARDWRAISDLTTEEWQQRLVCQVLHDALVIRKEDPEIQDILRMYDVPAFEALRGSSGGMIEGISVSAADRFLQQIGKDREASLMSALLTVLLKKYSEPADRWRGIYSRILEARLTTELKNPDKGVVVSDNANSRWFAIASANGVHTLPVRYIEGNNIWLFDGQHIRMVIPPVNENDASDTGQIE